MAFNSGKVQRPGAAPKAGAVKPRPAAAPRKSRYSGIKAGGDRDPMPHVGYYRFKVEAAIEGINPGTQRESMKIKMSIAALDDKAAENHREGDLVTAVHLRTSPGLSEMKKQVVACAGYEDENEFDAFDLSCGDDNGQTFVDSVYGAENDFSAAGLTIVGRFVDCRVAKGKDTADGDYYRIYKWEVVPEEEQDVAKAEFAA